MDRHKSDRFSQLEDALKSGKAEQSRGVNIQTGNNSPVVYAPHGKVEAYYNTEPAPSDALIPCPHCSRRVSRNAESCPGCGLNVEKYFRLIVAAQQREKFIKVFSVALFGVVFGISLKFFDYDPFGWLGEVFIFGSMITAVTAGKLIVDERI